MKTNFQQYLKCWWSEASYLHPADLFIPFRTFLSQDVSPLTFLTAVVFGELNKLASGTASLHLWKDKKMKLDMNLVWILFEMAQWSLLFLLLNKAYLSKLKSKNRKDGKQ